MVHNHIQPDPKNLPEELQNQQPVSNPAQSPGPNHPPKEKMAPDTEGLPIEESHDEDDNQN